MRYLTVLTTLAAIFFLKYAAQAQAPSGEWQFAVSGDSRNCGDIVMPTIARDVARTKSEFYWHLGDLRAIYDFDEDMKRVPGKPPLTIADYQTTAWQDFIENQVDFFKIPFYLGIGNHETILPKTREEFVLKFADWLNAEPIRSQRLQDDPRDHQVRAYYHWRQHGIEFINLDNASQDQFDANQLKWFEKIVKASEMDPTISTLVVGMHEALPDGLAADHSMGTHPVGLQSGRAVYVRLLEAQKHKLVYVLASHSHFFMEGVFHTPYWLSHGGELPSWIVGTAGAKRAELPATAGQAKIAKTNIYGYLLATVNPAGSPRGTVRFDFRQLDEVDVPLEILSKYGAELVHWAFAQNRKAPSAEGH